MPKEEPGKYSDSISRAIGDMERAQLDYKFAIDELDRLEKLTQDYLHSLELDGLHYKERAKVATKLAKCRQERRKAKDTIKALTPLIDYLGSENGKQFMNKLREALGKTRRAEKSLEGRVYVKRIQD